MRKIRALPALLAAALLLCACGRGAAASSPPAVSPAASAPAAEQLLFVPAVGDTLLLGAAALQNGEEASLTAELTSLGPTALFRIRREKPYGLSLFAVAGNAGQEFAGDFTLPGMLDEYGDLAPNLCAQFSVMDMDADGRPELAVSVGDRAFAMQTLLYRYAGGETPFVFAGAANGQIQMSQEESRITAPNTDAALSASYLYGEGALRREE